MGMQLNTQRTIGHKESNGKLMPLVKGTVTTVENPGITAVSALRRVRAKVEIPREKAKGDFMVIQITNKKDGARKVLEKAKRARRAKERGSRANVGIVANPAIGPVIVGESRSGDCSFSV